MGNWWIGMCWPEDCDLPPHTTLPAHSKLWAACMPYVFSLLFGDPSPQCYNYLCTWRWHLENHVSTPQHTLHILNFACHWCLAVFESACKQYVQLGVQHNTVARDCSFRDANYNEMKDITWSLAELTEVPHCLDFEPVRIPSCSLPTNKMNKIGYVVCWFWTNDLCYNSLYC